MPNTVIQNCKYNISTVVQIISPVLLYKIVNRLYAEYCYRISAGPLGPLFKLPSCPLYLGLSGVVSIKILLGPGVQFTSVALKSSPAVSRPGQRLSSPALLSSICTLKA